jgi:hypothetical protein
MIVFNHFLSFPIVSCDWWLVTPEMSRVRDGVYKTLSLFFLRAKEIAWGRVLRPVLRL